MSHPPPPFPTIEKCFCYYLLFFPQLDETTNLEGVEKAVAYFEHLHSVHLIQENVDHTILMSDHVKMTSSASELLGLEIKKLKVFMQVMEVIVIIADMMQWFAVFEDWI